MIFTDIQSWSREEAYWFWWRPFRIWGGHLFCCCEKWKLLVSCLQNMCWLTDDWNAVEAYRPSSLVWHEYTMGWYHWSGLMTRVVTSIITTMYHAENTSCIMVWWFMLRFPQRTSGPLGPFFFTPPAAPLSRGLGDEKHKKKYGRPYDELHTDSRATWPMADIP